MKFNLTFLAILATAAFACDREGYHCVGRGCGEPSSCCGGMRCMLDDGSCAGNGRIGTCVRGSFELDEKNFCDREGYHCVGRGCGEPSSCCGGLQCMLDNGDCAGNGRIGTCVSGSSVEL
ncbi:uncharacterized protein TrAFT101_005041 [Trichoderma asperellum]|uniref:Uncharacterized protein n=1 Tax=Trichoderma asperellum (strain ATCC 204424 / CBS 433.97 / NBRC 101777) TaxID=1042311 RepID=A0A2T3Z537_TRIA4|nr:hypothetical protein M441DRAFT_37831 [Trichoderma asperellum CBS 433.97]PTB39923.1 hypothetical protein M441DRAFT_37831 [Trichoderma asperellum CBS 433.97]UKZ90006.1 hypothetical protein TrAFT101_005041 [Trichoderma asperellum]